MELTLLPEKRNPLLMRSSSHPMFRSSSFGYGFMLQFMISTKRSAFFIILIVVGLMAYGLEYAQGWIVGRYPDITDVIGAIIGATIAGSLCLRWSRVFLVDTPQVNAEPEESLVT